MNPFVSGFLWVLGAMLAASVVLVGLGLVGHWWSGRLATRAQPAEPTEVPTPVRTQVSAASPPRSADELLEADPASMTHDELVRYVLERAALLDIAVRMARLRGVPIDMQLEVAAEAGVAKKRPRLILRARKQDGTPDRWPPSRAGAAELTDPRGM